MGRAAVIWPESCLSHREGVNVSDFKNVSRCSKVKVKIECIYAHACAQGKYCAHVRAAKTCAAFYAWGMRMRMQLSVNAAR